MTYSSGISVAEAIRRLDINNMAMIRYGSLQWQVYFREDRYQTDANTYLTDDLEDAVIQASKMRKAREELQKVGMSGYVKKPVYA